MNLQVYQMSPLLCRGSVRRSLCAILLDLVPGGMTLNPPAEDLDLDDGELGGDVSWSPPNRAELAGFKT